MSTVSIVAAAVAVWAAADLFVVWLRGGFRQTPDESFADEPGDGSWPEPVWDARSIESTLAEIESL